MHIVHHPRCNDKIQIGRAATLPVMRESDPQGQWIVSHWKPTAHELESLITGGGVELRVKPLGHEHPAVSLAAWSAICPEFVDGDSFMQRSTGYRCFQCCAREREPHAEHCIDLMGALSFAQSTFTDDGASNEGADDLPLRYPAALTAVLHAALRAEGFRTAAMMEVFRAGGHRIAAHQVAEDAFILGRMLRAVLTHGDRWARIFAAQLRVAQDVAIEKHEAAAYRKSAQQSA